MLHFLPIGDLLIHSLAFNTDESFMFLYFACRLKIWNAFLLISVSVWSYKSQQIKGSDNIVSKLYSFLLKKFLVKGRLTLLLTSSTYISIHFYLHIYLSIYLSYICVCVYKLALASWLCAGILFFTNRDWTKAMLETTP